jgi:CheY-like chemotaxis protein
VSAMTQYPSILLVSDDPDSAAQILEALRDARLGDRVQIVEHRGAATLFLHRRPPYQFVDGADVVLVDLDVAEAYALIDDIVNDESLQDTPVAAVASASADGPLRGERGRLRKPVDARQIRDVVAPLVGREPRFRRARRATAR